MAGTAIYQQLVRTERFGVHDKVRRGVAAPEKYYQRNSSQTQSIDILNEAKRTATPHHYCHFLHELDVYIKCFTVHETKNHFSNENRSPLISELIFSFVLSSSRSEIESKWFS